MKAILLLSGLALGGIAPALPGDCGSTAQSSCSKKTDVAAWTGEGETIVDTALKAGDFGTLATALTAADLVETLKGEGPFTVFAPTDAAFAKLPEGTLETLLDPENKGLLTSILTYHVVSGAVPAKQVVGLDHAATINGQRVDIRVDEKTEIVTVDGATVTTTDIQCSNGIIHVIDRVILPSSKDLIETAVDAGSFKTLEAALRAAGLAKTIAGEGPFTVFAPSDEAFAKLPEGTVDTLLQPENKAKLQAVLKYHVVPGRVYSDQALEAGSAKTLQGGTLQIGMREKTAYVGDAKLVATDIEAANGVIHVIDRVLLPE